MKDLYLAIESKLKTEVAAIKWIDFDRDQLLGQDNDKPVDYPCVLIDFPNTPYSNNSQNTQIGEPTIILRVAFRRYDRTHDKRSDNASLIFLDTLQSIYTALEGMEGENFSPLNRINQRRIIRPDIILYEIHFDCAYYDNTAQNVIEFTAAPANIIGDMPDPPSPPQPTYEAETEALWLRLSSVPSTAWKDAANTLIASLKTAGIWVKLDLLRVYAFHDATDALLNWVKDSHNGVAYNSPAFTAKQGYKGNGSSSYINTNFNPSTAEKLSLNNNSVIIYRHTDATLSTESTDTGVRQDGTTRLQISKTSGADTKLDNFGSPQFASGIIGQGMYSMCRNSSTAFSFYKNDSLREVFLNNSISLPNYNMYDFALNNANVGTLLFSDALLSFMLAGEYLNDTEISALYSALTSYLSTIQTL
jgi:hypothetical protein